MRFVLLSKCQRARFPPPCHDTAARGGKKDIWVRYTVVLLYNGVFCLYYNIIIIYYCKSGNRLKIVEWKYYRSDLSGLFRSVSLNTLVHSWKRRLKYIIIRIPSVVHDSRSCSYIVLYRNLDSILLLYNIMCVYRRVSQLCGVGSALFCEIGSRFCRKCWKLIICSVFVCLISCRKYILYCICHGICGAFVIEIMEYIVHWIMSVQSTTYLRKICTKNE